MAQAEAVDISRLVDERGITRFNIGPPIFEFFTADQRLRHRRALRRANRIVGEETAIRDSRERRRSAEETEPRCDQPGR
jgi:hypothetical protein